ncbi:MAG: copper resistance protein CopZ, partial [Acetatifactor sp.]|nr:copper resistance protein CopZ [Acetatifactor sp.]
HRKSGLCKAQKPHNHSNYKAKLNDIAHAKKQTVIIAEEDILEQELKNVIAKAGYEAVSVSSEPYEKKGLLSAFGR